MPNAEMPTTKSTIDGKYVVLMLLVLAAVVISGIHLALEVTEDETIASSESATTEQTDIIESEDTSATEPATTPASDEPEFASLLVKKPYYTIPFGAAEVEAYYTQVENATSLDGSSPSVTCSALVVVDGPEALMKSLDEARFGNPPTVIIGSDISNWTGINNSTKNNPAKLLVTLGTMFEGEAVGCMSVVFDTFTAIE